jgi:serine/threonine-protein kinase RsbW
MENELNFTSKIDNLVIIEKLIDDLSERFNFSSEVYGNILVAMVEAVNNAILHGNKSNTTKFVRVKYYINDHYITFVVKDEGTGFNINEVPDPTLSENLEKPNGRGLFLMKNLVDNIRFLSNGSEVELKFKIS